MNSGAKWPCAMCTYENWPAAFKCTLCGTPRTSVLIEDEMQRLRLSSNGPEQIDDKFGGATLESTQLTKCQSCTYLNQPQNFKCEQCFQILSDSPFLSGQVKQTSSIVSPSPIISSLSVPDKWICGHCTYENWPKSKRCVMCHATPSSVCMDVCGEIENKEFTSACISPLSSSLNIRRSKPTISNVGLSSRDLLWLSACLAVANGERSPIERYVTANGKIERKLTKSECRYLNTCLRSSNVSPDNNSGHFINMDQITKQTDMENTCEQFDTSSLSSQRLPAFTSEKVVIPINADSSTGYKFRSGLSLVDLALRFGRADLINLFVALSGLEATSGAISIGSLSKITPVISATTSGTISNGTTIASSNTSARNLNSQETLIQNKTGQLNRKLSYLHSLNQVHPALQHLLNRTPNWMHKTNATRRKWMPCQASPYFAGELRDLLAKSIKHRKGDFPCAYISEWGTFALPYSITKFPASLRQFLLSELCDMQAQSELEDEAEAINWWFIPGQKQASRLFALWNRTAGDCLLDSALQACWGVFDRENCLRRTLAETLHDCAANFYPRWRNYEASQAASHYILDEHQYQRDWENVLSAACQPREPLEQIHIFALSHILRRPIIVYGVKYIKNYRDEPIGIANFQGIYLPLLWDKNLCSPNPIVLGYTRGHFTALVPMEPHLICQANCTESVVENLSKSTTNTFSNSSPHNLSGCRKHSPTLLDETSTNVQSTLNTGSVSSLSESELAQTLETCGTHAYNVGSNLQQSAFIYLPLVDRQGNLLPIHFTTEKEADMSHTLLRDWLDVVCTRRGLPLARLRLHPKHSLVENMVEEWLDSYRSLSRISGASTGIQNAALMEEHSSSSTSASSDADQGEISKTLASEDCDSSP